MPPPRLHIGFCGGGAMSQALMQGLASSHSITFYDPSEACVQACTLLGARRAVSNAQVASSSQVVVLATKPQYILSVCKEIQSSLQPNTVIVSIAAGVSTSAIEQELAPGARVVRVMPNTPALVKSMAAGFCAGKNATSADLELVGGLLSSLGTCVQVASEDLINAVTGLSGSGPAYVFMFIEALADGGVKAGLPRDAALALAAQTVRGAAEMVLQTGKHPGALKDSVCSPGGTTIEAVAVLEEMGMRGAVIRAVVAASDKSRALGRPKM